MPISSKDFNKGSEVIGGQKRKGWKQKILKKLDTGVFCRSEIQKDLGISRVQMVKQYLDDMKEKKEVIEKYVENSGTQAHLFYTTQKFLDAEAKKVEPKKP